MTRDELVEALRLHGPEIVEAEEWRPLADHVLELVEGGLLRPTPPKGSEIEKAREFLATMLQNDSTERITLAALDALAREPVLLQRIEQAKAEGIFDMASRVHAMLELDEERKNAVHYTHLSRAEHGWAVWVYDYKVCEHSEQDRARQCAEMLEQAIVAAGTGARPGQFCPEHRHPGYRRVWLSDEAVEASQRAVMLGHKASAAMCADGGHSQREHDEQATYAFGLLCRDLAAVIKERG
jgi:hypothetical protein